MYLALDLRSNSRLRATNALLIPQSTALDGEPILKSENEKIDLSLGPCGGAGFLFEGFGEIFRTSWFSVKSKVSLKKLQNKKFVHDYEKHVKNKLVFLTEASAKVLNSHFLLEFSLECKYANMQIYIQVFQTCIYIFEFGVYNSKQVHVRGIQHYLGQIYGQELRTEI